MLEPMKKTVVTLGALMVGGALILAAAIPSSAQQPPGDDDTVRFRVQAGGRDLLKLATPFPGGDKATAQVAADVMANDLALSGYFKVIDPKAYLANLSVEGMTINPQDWKNVG